MDPNQTIHERWKRLKRSWKLASREPLGKNKPGKNMTTREAEESNAPLPTEINHIREYIAMSSKNKKQYIKNLENKAASYMKTRQSLKRDEFKLSRRKAFRKGDLKKWGQMCRSKEAPNFQYTPKTYTDPEGQSTLPTTA